MISDRVTGPVGLIIFDCDGVLVDSESIALTINRDMLAELGWHLSDDEIIERFLGRSVASNVTQIEDHLDRPLPADWLTRFNTAIRDAHEDKLTLVDGVDEALAALDHTGIVTCVASSGRPEKIEHSLHRVGLLDRFAGRMFSASDVEHGKPAPDLFLHAAARMGVAAARCVVVEDSQYGVAAARAAGMHAYGYAGGLTPAGWLTGPGTTLFTDMRDLPALIADRAARP